MQSLYFNTFHPLVSTPAGRRAIDRFELKPFIDGSIRREPDFEHRFPPITCICRGSMFAPRLRIGDVVVYLTVKRRYGEPYKHRRLVALLKVKHLFNTHQDAAEWYRQHGHDLPNNLIVPGNRANPVSKSLRACGPCAKGGMCGWDSTYKERVRTNGRVVVCTKLRLWLGWSSPIVTDRDFEQAIGYVPHTRNPGRNEMAHLRPLLDHLEIPAPRSVP